MKERPILFSGPMVRSLLAGTKTQTRRIVKPDGKYRLDTICPADGGPPRCPYGKPGDRLWVREAFRAVVEADAVAPRNLTPAHRIWYEADEPHQHGFGKLRPSMFMPRWVSRITLEVTGVRVERLQDISEADAVSEGCASVCMTPTGEDNGSAIHGPGGYAELWESINGPGSWDVNPWVWVVEFRRAA